MMRLDTLNPEQRKAVETTEGQLLILAGAGSGKTRVLTHRIAYILEQKLAAPENILAVTFTNKAAAEMKERIAKLIAGPRSSVSLPWMGTFHSICVKILRRDGHLIGLSPNYSIYDSSDQLDAVKNVMTTLNISQKDVNPRAILSHISSAKSEYVTPEDFEGYAKGYFQELVATIYPKYNALLRSNNAVDFDDLLGLTVKLFERNPDVLRKYQELYRYVLVDEYQDTNHVQYLLVTKLAEGYGNICVVGDDDQSIYAFRGATIKNILNFSRDYPDAEVVKLEQNYRSTKTILDAAYEVVKKNKGRTDKKLWTENIDGGEIALYTASSERDEAEWVARQIEALVSDSVHPEEIAVLYRTNAQSRALEEGMIKRGVNYRIVGGVRFYERKEIKDILAYLKVIHNPKDDGSITRIINTPRRGIGAKTISDIFTLSQNKDMSIAELAEYGELSSVNSKVATFGTLVSKIIQNSKKLGIVELINYVLEQTEYIKMLEDGSSENEARIENIKELISVATKYYDMEPQAALASFLEDVALVEAESSSDDSSGMVTLMTIHAAKGLEFEYVFVVGMEEGLFPHSRVFSDPRELEEERRLAYVAITRAKAQLYMTHAESRIFFGSKQTNLLSRFVEDIPAKLISKTGSTGLSSGWEEMEPEWDDEPNVEISSGEKVKHEYFGIGRVLKYDDSMVTIDFGPVYGIKELSRDFAPLQKV